ncbi:hypothetical protein [Acinetobacter bereziniae]|uniref:hypothetical protein n=2 Tax=Acinetobacter bereziniae TaxID=106648 RepID=UPI0005AAB2AD|nr:hypothetical protein [Acinetobacter bereziniae]
MNAVEFVKKFGWEEAKKAIAKVAWCETAYCTMIKHGCFKSNSDCCVDITDLKRIVESWEVIKTLGSLKSAKANLSEMYSDSSCDWVHENARLYDYKHLTVGRVNQAIADVESVGGGV